MTNRYRLRSTIADNYPFTPIYPTPIPTPIPTWTLKLLRYAVATENMLTPKSTKTYTSNLSMNTDGEVHFAECH